MIKELNRLVKDESGATAIEYALLAALIGVAIAGGASKLGTALNTQFTNASKRINLQ